MDILSDGEHPNTRQQGPQTPSPSQLRSTFYVRRAAQPADPGEKTGLARKSYDKAWKYAGASGFAPVLGPHDSVVFLAGLGIALGALVIIDSFGVVVGFVSSNPRAGEAIQAARRWARRILRRPPAADLEEGADTEEAARAALDALEQEAQKARLAHEKLQAAEAAEADRRAKVAAKQERLKQRARRIKIRPG